MRSKRLGALGVLVALGALILPVQNASANHGATLEIQVGHILAEDGMEADVMRFFPEDVTVHKGDTLKFMGDDHPAGGFHVPLLVPTTVSDIDAWIAENATSPDQPYAFVKPNPDYEGFGLKLLGDNGFTPRTDCGTPEEPCSFSGAEVVDARAPLFTYADFSGGPTVPPTPTGFNVTVDVEPGESFWVVDKLFTKSRMRVAVVNPNEESSTQEAIDASKSQIVSEERTAAKRVYDDLLNAKRVKRTKRGRIFTVYAGYDTDTVAFYDFFPQRLPRLRRGDRVRWEFTALDFEVHSATGPTKKGMRIHTQGQPLVCDPNGDSTSGGETEVTSFPPFCDPGVSEALLGDKMMGMAGDGVITSPTDLGHSGVRGPGLGTEPYTLKFRNKSGTKWGYVCVIHPNMRGTIGIR